MNLCEIDFDVRNWIEVAQDKVLF